MRVRGLAGAVVLAIAVSGCAVIQRSSVALVGEPNGASVEPALSADGSIQAFTSTATNLAPGDRNDVADVYLRDAQDHVTRISVSTDGEEANGPSSHPSLSADGRYVAFQSDATNLVAGDVNATTDVFVRDRVANTTTLASVPAPGAPATSATGPTAAARVTAPDATAVAPSLSSRNASLAARAALTPQRVIVRTTTTFAAEGHLSRLARTGQRGTIKRDQDAVAALIGSGGTVTAAPNTLPIVIATVDAAALGRLTSSSTVASITPDDPLPAELANSGPVVGLPAAQDANFTGRGEAVAILDTGVDSTHRFLANRTVDEACYSATGSCPNHLTTQTGPGSAVPCTYAPNGCRHGTHVAGIAAGSALDATGVAPRASIIAVQIFSQLTGSFCTRGEDPCPLTFPSDWILGLEHVYQLRNTYKIAAANMSIGGITSLTACDGDAVKPAIDQLKSVGIATVIAAGNEGSTTSIDYPACISSSVSVGATDDADSIATFSNSHPLITLFAPGVGVRSSVPGGGFALFNGTSMATPHVTGAFALAREQDPNATVDEIVARMRTTGRSIHDARNNVDTPRLCVSGALGFDRCPNRNGSRRPSVSGDGQKIAFESDAPLVATDTNGKTDVYLRDRSLATTERVSIATTGTQSSGASTHPSLGSNGDRVAFDSVGSELVPGDTNGVSDVFVRHLPTAITERASVTSAGLQVAQPSRDASIAVDASSVVFSSLGAIVVTDTNALTDVYSHDLGNGTTSLLSIATDGASANGESRHPSVGTGRFVGFESDATNLGPDTNHATDIYVRDRYDGLTQRVSTSFFGGEAGSWSASPVVAPNGGVFAMTSAAADLVSPPDDNAVTDIYRRFIVTPQITGFTGSPVPRAGTVPFTISGRGFLGPLVVTSNTGITLTVTGQSENTITGTLTAAAAVAPGQYNLSVTNLGSLPGFFGATVCPGCITVA